MSDYRVKLETFAGPLDLLLYLVRKEEVDIYDIPIARITEQYIEYIQMLERLDIELAGEFLVMAATLMEIKSAMLLPKADVEGAAVDAGDPRGELIRQLLEYKKFKDAANFLDDAADRWQERFGRPASLIDAMKGQEASERELDLDQISIWTLLEAFDHIMQATGRYDSYDHITDDTPIDLYQIEILHRLQSEGPMTFERVFEGRNNRMILTGLFLAMLELIRSHLVWAEQEERLSAIYIKALTDVPAQEAVAAAIYANTVSQEASEAKQDRGQEGQREVQDKQEGQAGQGEASDDIPETTGKTDTPRAAGVKLAIPIVELPPVNRATADIDEAVNRGNDI